LPPTKDVQKLLGGATANEKLCLHLLHRGVATMGARFFIISTAHTEEDINQTMEAFDSALEGMVAEGTLEAAK